MSTLKIITYLDMYGYYLTIHEFYIVDIISENKSITSIMCMIDVHE